MCVKGKNTLIMKHIVLFFNMVTNNSKVYILNGYQANMILGRLNILFTRVCFPTI